MNRFRTALAALFVVAVSGAAFAANVEDRNPIINNGKGLVVGNPTGGELGPGTVNTKGVYVDGVPVAGGLSVPSSCVLAGTGTALAPVTLGGGLTCPGGVLTAPTGGSGTVTSTGVATANGFSGTVANPTTTPTITITVPVTGLLKGNGTGVSAAAAGTDFIAPTGSGASLTGLTFGQIGGAVAPAALPIATTSALGAFKPDGSTITVNSSTGVASAVGGAATSVVVGTTTVGGASNGTVLGVTSGTIASLPATGSGNAVLATSPTLVTPALGTPSAAVLTNATGLPIAGLTGLGTGVATSMASAVTGSGGHVLATSPTIASPTITGTTTTAGITDSVSIASPALSATTSVNVSAGASGYKIGGTSILNVIGSPGANTSTIIGSNAGALVPSNSAAFVTFIGDSVGQKYVGTGGGNEVFCAGSLSCGNLTTGSHDVALGIGAMWWETTGGNDTCVGSDTCRDTQGVSGVVALGQGALGDTFGADNVAIGLAALAGNSATIQITGTLAAGDVLSGSLTLTGATLSPFAWTYTVQAGDTIANLAINICAANSAFGNINGLPGGSFRCSGSNLTINGVSTAVVGMYYSGTSTLGSIITPTAATTGAEVLTITGGASGGFNTAVGFGAMRGSIMTTATSNVAFGHNVLANVTSAQNNSCGGYQSCLALTSGAQNAVWGALAGAALTTANSNILIGYQAGTALTTGSTNVLISVQAGLALTTGIQDVLIGRQAGKLMTTNGNSTCVGDLSCSAVVGGANNGNTAFGQSAGASITTGHFNLALGPDVAMTTLTTGSGNVVIGTAVACDVPTAATNGAIVICGSAGPVITSLSTGTPSTSTTTIAGGLVTGVNILSTSAAPTINSGFGTTPTIAAGTSSVAFQVNVGTGGTATTGALLMPIAAPHGWACPVVDTTNPATSNTVATSTTASNIVLTNYSRTTAQSTPVAWAASDVLTVGPCVGF